MGRGDEGRPYHLEMITEQHWKGGKNLLGVIERPSSVLQNKDVW